MPCGARVLQWGAVGPAPDLRTESGRGSPRPRTADSQGALRANFVQGDVLGKNCFLGLNSCSLWAKRARAQRGGDGGPRLRAAPPPVAGAGRAVSCEVSELGKECK